MEEYGSNSYKSKAMQPSTEAPKKKEIKKVVKGPVKTKKKGDLSKLFDEFITDDLSSIKSYILMDVLVPTIKNAICSIIKNGTDMLLWGRIDGSQNKGPASRISYGSYFSGSGQRSEPRYSQRSQSTFDYEEIVFANRSDAEAVLNAMDEIIGQYGLASVGDLYELAQVSTHNYAINKYGWTDIRSAAVVHVRDGWMIKFPKAMPFN